MIGRSTRTRLAIRAAAFCLLAAHAAPGPAADPSPPAPATEPTPGFSLLPAVATERGLRTAYPSPTDDLMAPGPAVPPRRSFQRPETPEPDPVRPDASVPQGVPLDVPVSATRDFKFIYRYGVPFQQSSSVLPDGTRRFVVTGGIIVNVGYRQAGQEIEFATDNAVIWVRGLELDFQKGFSSGGSEGGEKKKVEIELYMSGNVVIRTQSERPVAVLGNRQTIAQTLRAEQIYYDAERSRAIATVADLELAAPSLADNIHLKGREIWRLGTDEWQIRNADIYSSKLPSDPGLKLSSQDMNLVEQKVVRRNIFGLPYRKLLTGEKVEANEQILTSKQTFVELLDIPIFYLPYLRTDVTDPLGPFQGLGIGVDRVFGDQVYTTWDMFKLLALVGPPNHKWQLNADYLSFRGPALGTTYSYTLPALDEAGDPIPGLPSNGYGLFKIYGISDHGTDLLGGDRGPQMAPPPTRGRVLARHVEALSPEWFFQGQAALVTDQNYIEQYYKNEWDNGPNQETFAYLTWQRGNLWASGLIEPKIARPWIAETMSLPRFDGNVVGQSLFDSFTYNARLDAGYFESRPSQSNPYPVLPTDVRDNTGRIDFNQELSLPFSLGAFKFAPYVVADLADYTNDAFGINKGRAYGAGGVRASLPFSHLYADANSELLNARGLYHKAVLSANYYDAYSSAHYYNFPYLDRLTDDATDQAYRNMRVMQTLYVPGAAGTNLQFSPIYDPQTYAIRRLTTTSIDTLDSIDVLQVDLRQRLQTKRGYTGQEHVVDLAIFDVSASYFPQATRDNYGHPFSFLEYDFLWNLGDRTSIVSNGWLEPYAGGTRYYNVGGYVDRPDRTSLYVGYRQTDPLRSKAVTASVGYQMSPKYFTSLAVTYDFGIQAALSNVLSMTRTGTDLSFTFGVTYNAFQNNFGVQFLVVPNLVAALSPGRFGTTGSLLGR